MRSNPMHLTDGYKLGHPDQYPEETRVVVSNGTPRKSRVKGINSIVVFGIQAYMLSTLVKIWKEDFFDRDVEEVAAKFYRRIKNYAGVEAADKIGVERLRQLHALGYLPLQIKAIPEGRKLPIGVPAFTVKNTHDDFYWLTNLIETDMSSETWQPSTSATTADEYRKILTHWAEKTGGDVGFVQFQGHDFSYRGMPGRASAMASGAGHLLSFVGTDTIPAIDWLEEYYSADSDKELVGCSIFATEHAVMCVGTGFYIKKNKLDWEKYGEAEFEVFKRLITEVYPSGMISIVSDTWDLWKVLREYLPRLREEILARDGKIVIRPDSGDPAKILTGYKVCSVKIGIEDEIYHDQSDNTYYDISVVDKVYDLTPTKKCTHEIKGVVECLWDIFGGTFNERGYKVLNPKVGCIYGDSITLERAWDICKRLADNKFCSTNWVAGIGSYTYQYVTRDTFGWAIKATYATVEIDGKREGINIQKNPITDDGTKKSACGLLAVFENPVGKLELHQQVDWETEAKGELKTIFENGKVIKLYTLSEIRETLKNQ